MLNPILILGIACAAVGLMMTGVVCLGSWIDGHGGCPAKMPWEMGAAVSLEGRGGGK